MDGLTRHYHEQAERSGGARTAGSTSLPMDRAPRLLLTVEEAAERIGICRAYMFKLIRQGDVRSVKVGRLRRVTPAALEDFVARLSRADGEERA
jgi:excisionase family DNA binding protein